MNRGTTNYETSLAIVKCIVNLYSLLEYSTKIKTISIGETMKKILYFTMIALLIMGGSYASDSKLTTMTPENEKAAKIDKLLKYSYENGVFNGTILVSEKGSVIYKKAFGYADFKTKELLKPQSSFYLASVSKQFTTMGIMILKERGKLSYDDKLTKYFPEFSPFADAVTIRHMMTHTSGIPDHYRLGIYKDGLTNDDVLNTLVKHNKLDFSVGEKYSYSNGAYVLLSLIAAKTSGMAYHVFMRENIFEPLAMNHTLIYDESSPKVNNRAKGYDEINELDDYTIFTTGAGGMYTTVEDLFKWDRALYTDKLISQDTLSEAFKPFELNSGEMSTYGFGWGIKSSDNKTIVSHSGGMNGYRTYMNRNITDDMSFMLLTNNGNAFAFSIRESIGQILSNQTYKMPKFPVSRLYSKLMKSGSFETVISEIRRLVNDKNSLYEINEDGINRLGYTLLAKNYNQKAIDVFKLNVQLNPKSSNPYDSLGEAYMADGQTALAIKNYEKTLSMDSRNQWAKSQLAKLKSKD